MEAPSLTTSSPEVKQRLPMPKFVLLKVLEYCDPADVNRFRRTCQTMRWAIDRYFGRLTEIHNAAKTTTQTLELARPSNYFFMHCPRLLPTVHKLSILEHWQILPRGWKHLSWISPYLTELHLTEATNQSLMRFTKACYGSTFRCHHLILSRSSLSNEGINAIAQHAVRSQSPLCRRLDLQFTQLVDSPTLGSDLSIILARYRLLELNLSNTQVGGEVLKKIANCLINYEREFILDLSYTEIGKGSIQYLSRKLPTIRNLSVIMCKSQVTEQTLELLKAAARDHNTIIVQPMTKKMNQLKKADRTGHID